MDKYLHIENTIFCSSNCNYWRFSAHNMSLLLIFSLFLFYVQKHGVKKLFCHVIMTSSPNKN